MSIYQTQSSPLGELLLAGEETEAGVALTSVSLPGQRNAPGIAAGWQRAPGAFALVTRQLDEYFAGQRTRFDLRLAPRGPPFQQRIWQALDAVRYGTTITYGELAAQLGVPRDRIVALGAAIGANPLLIIRTDGTMKGYAGGVERKQWLLVHEGILLPELAVSAPARWAGSASR